MDKKLLIQAITKFILGVMVIALLLFVSSGTLSCWNAWLFMGILFIPMFVAGIVLMIKNPDLLRKRLNAEEKESKQKSVIMLSGAMFLSGFIIAGLDYRFRWLYLPKWVSIIAAIIFLFAYMLYAEVLRENTYLSRAVEIQDHQKVIDTGLYGIVRHPMYSATLFLFLTIPLVLGSLCAFLIFLVYPILIAKRIRNEEHVLEEGLEGYSDYEKRVKYRMIPFVW
jgi:protein-S-isoprenylcysteine O-methyltransferase Ste14